MDEWKKIVTYWHNHNFKLLFVLEGKLTQQIIATISHMGFLGSSDGKESACNVGDLGSIPGLGRSPEGGNGHSSTLAWRIPHGQRSLVGYSPWGCNESDTTEWLSTAQHISHIMPSTTFASGRHSITISWMTGGMNTVLSENRVWYAYLK